MSEETALRPEAGMVSRRRREERGRGNQARSPRWGDRRVFLSQMPTILRRKSRFCRAITRQIKAEKCGKAKRCSLTLDKNRGLFYTFKLLGSFCPTNMFKQILKSVRGGAIKGGQKHWGIFALALFVFVGNLLPRQNAVALGSELTLMPEEEIESIVTAISNYTPDLSEDAKLASISFDSLGGFLGSKPLSSIQKEPIKYEVQKGDTYSIIAQKFELHVATILDFNNIDAKNTKDLQPGQILTIPLEDTSSSMAWLDEENKANAEARKAEEKKRQQKLAQKQKQLSQKNSVARADSGFEGDNGGNLIMPIRHNGITRGLSRFHTGIDYRADIGTTVVAAAAGKVVEKTGGWGSGWGLSIVVDHGGGRTTRYAHLSSFGVSVGDYVEQGQVVGYSGNSGWSTGPHLHFEERINGRPVTPF